MRFFRILLAVGVLLVGGIILLVGGIKDKVSLNKRMDFSEIDADDLRDGMFVEGTIIEMWDDFAYETNDSSTYQYYAMPLETSYVLDHPVFVAVKLTNSTDKATASKMSKETDNYYIRDIEPDEWTVMPMTGKVHMLKGEIRDYFEEYIEEMGYSPSVSMEPYVISRYNPGNENIRLIVGIVMALLGFLILGFFVFFVVIKR